MASPAIGASTSVDQTSYFTKIQRYLGDKITHLAFRPQFNQLSSRNKLVQAKIVQLENLPEPADSRIKRIIKQLKSEESLISYQYFLLEEHVKKVPLLDKIKLIGRQIFRFSFVRQFILKYMLHRAIRNCTFEILHAQRTTPINIPQNPTSFTEAMEKGDISHVAIHTADHQQLDGCIVYANPRDHYSPRPTMVMARGNEGIYEAQYAEAKAYAEKYGVNVILYNPRGVEYSLGQERSTQDAIEDCKAVILYALDRFCQKPDGGINYQNLVVHGHSWGGGVTANALLQLSQEGRLPTEGIGLYINQHSFTSLPKAMSAALFKNSKIIAFLARVILAFIGLNTLDAESALAQSKYKLARNIVVTSSTNDKDIYGAMQLSHALKGNKTQNQIDQMRINLIENDSLGHLDLKAYVNLEGERVKYPASNNDANMARYHTILKTWLTQTAR